MEKDQKFLFKQFFKSVCSSGKLNETSLDDSYINSLNKIIIEYEKLGLEKGHRFMTEDQLNEAFNKHYEKLGMGYEEVQMKDKSLHYVEPNPILAEFLANLK